MAKGTLDERFYRSKAELIAEMEAMRHRLEALENRSGKERRNSYLLRVFIDALPNFGFSFDVNGRILQVLTGSQVSETRVLEGRLLADVLPDEDVKVLETALRKTFETQKVQRFELVLSMLAGRRWYQVRSFPVSGEGRDESFAVFLFQDVTNEKLAEGVLAYAQTREIEADGNLRRSEERFRNLVAGSLQGVCIHRNLKPVFVNQALATMFGYRSPGDFIARVGSIFELMHPDEKERHLEFNASRNEDEPVPATYETRFLHRDGHTLWVELFVRVVEWEGEVAHQTICVDITERKQAEASLAKISGMMANAEAIAHLGAMDWDLISEKQVWSDELFRIIGHTPQAFQPNAKSFADSLHPEDKKSVLVAISEAIDARKPIDIECRVVRPNGEIRVVHAQGRIHSTDSGVPSQMVGTVQDITERKKAAEKLQASEERFRDFAEASADWFWEMDAELRFTFVTANVEQIVGKPPEWHFGKTREELLRPDFDREAWEEHYQTLREHRSFKEFTFHRVGDGFPDRWVSTSGVPVFDREGNFSGYRGTGRDVTERMGAQEKLRASELLAVSAQTRLMDAVDSIPEGFALFDAADRLILCNSRYKETNTSSPANLVPGQRFEDILRGNLSRGEIPEALGREEEWLKQRMYQHAHPAGPFERLWRDGRWLRIQESRTREGGIVGLWNDITPIKRAAEALTLSEEKYRNLIEGSLQGIVVHRDFDLLFANQAYAEIFGFDSPEELLEVQDHRKFFAPGELARVQKYYSARFADENVPEHYEFQGIRKDGTVIWVDTMPKKVMWGGEPAIQTCCIDVSERRRAEQKLRSSQLLLRTVFDSIPHWVFAKDRESRFIMVNRAFAESYGKHPRDFSGKLNTEMAIGNESEMAWFQEMDRQVIESGQVEKFSEYPSLLPDGRVRISRMHKSPLRDDDGNVVGLVGVAEDVTEQRKVEEALRDNERLLQTMLDSIPHWVFVKDRESRYLMVNKGMASAFNRKPEDFVGAPTKEFRMSSETNFGTADELEKLVEMDQQVIETKKPVEAAEFLFTSPKGEKRYHHITKVPLLDAEGSAVGVVGVSENITERKATEEQLRQSQKMDAVGQLAGGVAHDFNNMLQIIQGYTRLAISAREQPEQVSTHLKQVLKGAEGASSLTRQLLAFSRREVMQPRDLDSNALVSNLAKMVGRIIGENIELKVKPCDGEAWIHADPGMMDQVILNLCVNARDAMPDGGKLHIQTSEFFADEAFCKTHGWEAPGHYVLIAVSDSGIGMTREVQAHIFEPFFTTKEAGKGTGLGLSTVYGIVKQHEGMVNVYSEPGVGTTFNIYIPRLRGQGAPLEALAEEGGHAPGGTETVLVAEDEEEVRELVRLVLEGNGYRVVTAANGNEAFEVFSEKREAIDVVILDVIMPEKGGRAAFEEIRKLDAAIPVVFATGYAAEAIDEKFIEKNQLRLIRKPYSPTELLQAVREALDVRKHEQRNTALPA